MKLPAFAHPAPAPGPQPVPPRPKRRTPSLYLWWALPLLLIAAGAGYLRLQTTDRKRAADSGGGAAVSAVALSLGEIRSEVRIAGSVVAEQSAIIRAPRIMGSRGDFNRGGGGHGGPNHDFTLALLRLAKPGTRVKAGDVVAEFDPESQMQRYDDYQDSVVQLKNSIRKMTANLAAGREAHEQKVRAALAAWQKAQLDLKTAAIRSQIDAEKLRLLAEEAELKYRQLLVEEALVEESQQASIRNSQLSLKQSAIELERAQLNVKRMSLTAPIDGIVVMSSMVMNGELRQIREGDQVAAGQPVLYVVDTRSMALNAAANQVDAERMRVGMRAAIRLDAHPDLKLTGTIIGLGAMAKVSSFRAAYVGEIPVRLRIEGNDPRLLPDLTGSADILLNVESNVLVAPRPAVITENGDSFVFLRDGNVWTRRKVVTGLQSPTHIALREGVRAGENIALEPPI